MGDISLSKAVRSNLLSLQNTSAMMGKTQDRLATGNKVNSALDNPTNFFTASSLNSRAGDLNQLMDSMANGIQTIEAANNGLTSITKTLESMQSTLRQARQDKSFQTGSFEVAKDTDAAAEPGSIKAGSITFEGGSTGGTATTAKTVTVAAGDTLDDVVAKINKGDVVSGVRASNDNGKLRIENLSTSELKIGATDSVTVPTDGGTIDGNSVRADLAEQYNDLRDQLDKLADDASFNGINLLRGDKLKLTFNETGTSELDIQSRIGGTDGATVNAATLGIETQLQKQNLDTDSDIDGFIANVKTALNTVRSQASAFGSSLSIVQNRQDFSKSMINTLQTGAANLTLADMNEEAANLLALQTRQSLSSNSLSLASQADQSVLQLIR
ncbi:flagellin hook IN motif-containing protein [Devosia sp. 1566]|uniref:flagellin N-terminal helical domain-containing protein n=1 Tax=Devosia sp. 1566 TaxID=2499144 RepID=UPI000FD867E3|nr:flagellin hook IN motif-containing protein [Devosia sp. 1566]